MALSTNIPSHGRSRIMKMSRSVKKLGISNRKTLCEKTDVAQRKQNVCSPPSFCLIGGLEMLISYYGLWMFMGRYNEVVNGDYNGL